MNFGISFSSLSIFYSILLIKNFFNKKRINSYETKLYGWLVLTNFAGLILAIMCYFGVLYSDTYPIFAYIISRGYLVYLTSWIIILTIYVMMISTKSKNLSLYFKNVKIIMLIIGLLASTVTYILPLEYINKNGLVYSQGAAANFTFLIGGVLEVVCFIYMIKNYKKLKSKKYYPIIFYMTGGTVVMLIQKFCPGLLLMTSAETFVTFLMYFTIENPDVKLINELELAKNQAEKANRAKTDFLSSMSHEIRTPLNAIVGLSEIIKTSDNLDEIHEDANDVVMASLNLLEIVNGILDISKIEADKMEVIETNYSLKETLEELKKLTEIRIGEKDIELRCNFAVDLPDNLYGDKGKIKQIVTNLLTNAVKYTDKGYIDFDVSSINEKNCCKLKISVSDTGRGIKKEQMDKLFTKFNRLEEDMNTTIEGTGLGLAITKSLVELMGGNIVVHSTYGEGSKFTVFISQKISDGVILNDSDDEIITFDNKKVLIVDDNNLNIKVASKILKEFNLIIESAYSGQECLNKVKDNNYDLILMDIMMPKMSGVETLKKLKENSINTPVVALTADAIQGQSNKYIEVGFNDYLSKPIQKNELKRVLNKCLNGIVENNVKEIDNDIHKVSQIKDEDIELLNKKLEEVDMNNNEKNNALNIQYLKENDIDVDASLELLGDIDMYNETLNTFINESKERIQRLEKYKSEKNMKDYSIDVHAMKSDSKYLGFKKLAEISYEHEMKSKENDINYVLEHYDELLNEYNRIINIIGKYLRLK